ncbi:MAG: hypothetical protein RI958_2278 [Actinomycetota bacterium]|jgi:hypothetical protein
MDPRPAARDTGTGVYRVTVRGRFRDLSDAARRFLTAAQSEHDIFRSAYTAEGTFTYDERITFFNLRYEVRIDRADPSGADDPSGLAGVTAEVEAESFLTTMGFGYLLMKTEVVDVSAVWTSLRPRHGTMR